MAIVNFSIPQTLCERVNQEVKNKGFASRAEFFRFAAIYFMDIVDIGQRIDEKERMERLSSLVSKKIAEHYQGKKILSLREQLADL